MSLPTRGASGGSPWPRIRRVTVAAALGPLLGLALAGCGVAAPTGPITPAPTLALPTYSTAIAETRRLIAAPLVVDSLQLQDATQPFRPPEPPAFIDAPRGIFQVILPADPAHGYIVVYEFRDVATAATAGRQLASFVGTGPGRVEFPPDTQHVIRQLGTTIVDYSWSPANSTDARAPKILTALATVGIAVSVPQ